jgi:hypothetical protein
MPLHQERSPSDWQLRPLARRSSPRAIRWRWSGPDDTDVYSMWAHLWWDEAGTDFTDFHAGLLTESYIRSEDTAYNVMAW